MGQICILHRRWSESVADSERIDSSNFCRSFRIWLSTVRVGWVAVVAPDFVEQFFPAQYAFGMFGEKLEKPEFVGSPAAKPGCSP